MIYTFSSKNRGSKFLDIELIIDDITENEISVQLPAWRPGRYELANFAKNIQQFSVKTLNNKPLFFEKVTKDKWRIYTGKSKKIKIEYNYYANELNAGSTWVDENQIYVNPVNCCLYVEGRAQDSIKLFFNKTNHKQAATSLQKIGDHFVAENFDELADSPFILSDSLKHNSYVINDTKFNIWFQGECKPDWDKIIRDFKAFTKEQLKIFGSFPFDEYHFLNQILPYKGYHGVEHKKNTVISFGPGYSVFKGENYEEFLGVSSHELFHAWNVKSIRPAEMLPYDFTKENYTKMGYLTEGITTYYGDLMLKRSGVFNTSQYLKQINKILERHFFNYGAQNMSVADSSFDTWLDGYERGIPNRKSSIYTEGCLLALITDLQIRTKSKGKNSLDNVMRAFYHDYYQKGNGITENNFIKEINKASTSNLDDLWENYFNGTKPLFPVLKKALKKFGIKLNQEGNPKYLAAHYGLYNQPGTSKALFLAPKSPAFKAGINVGDEIISINNISVEKDNINNWAEYFGGKLKITIKKNGLLKEIELNSSPKKFFNKVSLSSANSEKSNASIWLNK
ncbi:hypothetical protein N8089_04205 [Flavobacteriales bacterium]|nr:hypothetical protein [Flavobacteriales bacterium]